MLKATFLVCLILGSALLITRIVLLFMGFDGDDIDSVDDIDIDDVDDSDTAFKLLSLQTISSFFTMFGLVGWLQADSWKIWALLSASAAGGFSVWMVGKVFQGFLKLHSSGNIGIDDTIGCTGKVYLRIPVGGEGKVLITVKKALREYAAVSQGDEEIWTGAPIRVVWVDGGVLVVERVIT